MLLDPKACGMPGTAFAGDVRAAEQVGLTSMHTLFMREHNRLADLIAVQKPGATDEEIRRAYKRMCAVFDPENLVTFGLFDEEGLDAARTRVDEAYDVLLDPARRRPYEISVFPEAPEDTVEAKEEEVRSEPVDEARLELRLRESAREPNQLVAASRRFQGRTRQTDEGPQITRSERQTR